MKNLPLLIMLVALSVVLVGCKSLRGDACLKPGAYVSAQNAAPLKVPEGLDAPDTRAALRIPDLKAPAKPRAATAGCLDTPPKFVEPKASRPPA
jgi:uncharacterized lipoprotein